MMTQHVQCLERERERGERGGGGRGVVERGR